MGPVEPIRIAMEALQAECTKAARKIPQNLWTVAHRKLDMLNAAHGLMDLTAPPANRLEALKGDWKGLRQKEMIRQKLHWNLQIILRNF